MIITFIMLKIFYILLLGTIAPSLHSESGNPFVSGFIFMGTEKLCRMCNTVKPHSEYNKNKARHNGIYSMCADCRRKRTNYPKSKDIEIFYCTEKLLNERWQPVLILGEYFPYKISDCGRVLLKNGEIAKPSFDQRGYPQIVLSKNKVRVGRRIHILVASHFVENPNNLPQVNHLDGNKLNPHYTNLVWDTPKGNMTHAVENGLWKPHTSETHGNSVKVIDTLTGCVYPSITAVENKFNISRLGRKIKGDVNNNTNFKLYKG